MIYEETFTCNHKICDTYGALDALLSLPYKSSKILLRPYDFSFYCWIIAEQVSSKFEQPSIVIIIFI